MKDKLRMDQASNGRTSRETAVFQLPDEDSPPARLMRQTRGKDKLRRSETGRAANATAARKKQHRFLNARARHAPLQESEAVASYCSFYHNLIHSLLFQQYLVFFIIFAILSSFFFSSSLKTPFYPPHSHFSDMMFNFFWENIDKPSENS